MFFEVIPTEVYRSGGGALTYSFDQKLLPGHLVLIPLGRKVVTGIVLREVKSVDFPTKPIYRLIHPIPLPGHILKSITWLANYYLAPLPAVANLFLPAGIASRTVTKTLNFYNSEKLEATSKAKQESGANYVAPATKARVKLASAERDTHKDGLSSESLEAHNLPQILLNPAQKQAIKALQEAPGATRLLRGVTGSGKTNIYLKLAENALKSQKSVILLVPEIALTSQLVQIFEQTFGNRVVLIHSNQTLVERRNVWLQILNNTFREAAKNKASYLPKETKRVVEPTTKSDDPVKTGVGTGSLSVNREFYSREPLVIIGPRSALLTPVHNLGLIIVDEAHETAYYQENTPRYSATRLASFMASTLKIPCLLGTATPNLTDYYLAKSKHSLVELSQKAKTTALDPKISIIDLKNRDNFLRNRYFSNQLLTKIETNLQDKHQTLIFHNRRGSSPLTICEDCGWQALCPNCYLPLTLHADSYTLSCHLCGHETKVPSSCPSCHGAGILHKGFGTKLLESELKNLFPNAKIARFDGDNKKTDDLAALYHDVKTGNIDILIGTQTLARGLDLPHLATVGIVQADAGLALPDFAAEERTFELLNQVIGRVGRGHLDIANVVIQTFQPDHPVIQTAMSADYPTFADYLLKKRHQGSLPPYTYLARLSITYKTEKTTLAKIRTVHAALSADQNLTVSPPMPAFHERTGRGFTWQIILKSTSREHLRKALTPYAYTSQYSIVLDPPSLL